MYICTERDADHFSPDVKLIGKFASREWSPESNFPFFYCNMISEKQLNKMREFAALYGFTVKEDVTETCIHAFNSIELWKGDKYLGFIKDDTRTRLKDLKQLIVENIGRWD